jgi:hypothetical protein
MLQNIKKSIKESDKREREGKEESPFLHQNELMCVRSQIHQIYNNSEEKMELYKMIKSNETRILKRESSLKNEKHATLEPPGSQSGAKFIMNPFLANRTIVCFTMALN